MYRKGGRAASLVCALLVLAAPAAAEPSIPQSPGAFGQAAGGVPRAPQVDKQIAYQLFPAPATVNNHVGRTMRKLGVHTRTALAARLSDQDQQ